MASSEGSPIPMAHALVVAFPLQGHLNPLMRFSKTLAKNGFLITFVNADFIHHRIPSASRNPLLPTSQAIRLHHIPLPGLDLHNDFRVSFQALCSATQRLSSGVEQLIERFAQERTPVTCLISDVLLSTSTQKVADKFHIPRIAVFTSSLSRLLFVLYLLNGQICEKDAIIASRKRDNPSALFHRELPGLVALRDVDLPYYKHIEDDTEFLYGFASLQCKVAFESAHTIVVNSFEDLEGPAFEAMRKQLNKRIYGVGPLLEELQGESNTGLWKEEDDCLEWLDCQSPQTVLYVSFGSITMLPRVQFEEVCAGLEASNQRFLWAFRPDLVEGSANGSLPQDFLVRTQDRGYVVKWAPQLRVLSHPSIGGFLTHCGWNSTMESIAKGVPMLCWPYIADQFLNARYVVEEWKVGVRCEQGEGGMVGRGEVERVVRGLMEGEAGMEVRTNAVKLRHAALKSQSEGGSSHSSIKALLPALWYVPH